MRWAVFFRNLGVLLFAAGLITPSTSFGVEPDGVRTCLMRRLLALLSSAENQSKTDVAFRRARVNAPHIPAGARAEFFMPKSGGVVLSEFIDGEAVSVGATAGPGVHEIYFRNLRRDDISEQFLLFMDVLRKGAINKLKPTQMGIVLHIESPSGASKVYQVIDGALISNAQVQARLMKAQKTMLGDFRDFVIEQYEKRLHIPKESLMRLREISEATQSRTLYLLKTEEGYFRTRKGTWVRLSDEAREPVEDFTEAELRMPEHFTFEGGISAVLSRSGDEPLPLEMFTGFTVPRPENGYVVEIGRYAVSKDLVTPVSPRLVEQIVAAINGQKKVAKIVIEADEAHARLFSKYGFRSIHTRRNYNNEIDHIMETDPQSLLETVLEKHFPDEPVAPFSGGAKRPHSKK